jgi:ribosomal protein S11
MNLMILRSQAKATSSKYLHVHVVVAIPAPGIQAALKMLFRATCAIFADWAS